jgi:hypothetical protein
MKKNNLKLLIFSLLLIVGQVLMAQPPNPPSDPSTGNEVVGGDAPVGGGLEILLLMGLAYGSKKTYNIWKSKEKLED